jgi:hypothetical protein
MLILVLRFNNNTNRRFMDVHINKKIAGLMLFSLFIGGAIGGGIGFIGGNEEGRHNEKGDYVKGERDGYDNRADGETSDNQGSVSNSDEQVTKTDSITMQKVVSTTTPVTSTTKTQ